MPINRHLSGFLGTVLLPLVAACGGAAEPTGPSDSTVSSVRVTPAVASLLAGQTLDFTVELQNSSGDVLPGSVSWSSSNEAVLTVSATGRVTALLPGTATLTATFRAVSGTAEITSRSPT